MSDVITKLVFRIYYTLQSAGVPCKEHKKQMKRNCWLAKCSKSSNKTSNIQIRFQIFENLKITKSHKVLFQNRKNSRNKRN